MGLYKKGRINPRQPCFKNASAMVKYLIMATKIIAGLGNPGIQYRKSRHNAGYQALERLADTLHIRLNKRGFSGVYGEGVRNGQRVVLIKPTTYMNLSGNCVQAVMHFFKAAPEDLIVLYDDVDLPVGGLRIRGNGSAGTHNGMRSIVACVGSEDFARVRIGVGNRSGGELANYVLGKPGQEERKLLETAFDGAADAVCLILDGRLVDAQAKYNKKHMGVGQPGREEPK